MSLLMDICKQRSVDKGCTVGHTVTHHGFTMVFCSLLEERLQGLRVVGTRRVLKQNML